ncbi:Acyltransferase family, partial [Globisporangium polare]
AHRDRDAAAVVALEHLRVESAALLGKISFSVYLLHSFVIYSPFERKQENYYDRLFSEFLLTLLLSTASYRLSEVPCQLISGEVSKALEQWGEEGGDSDGKSQPSLSRSGGDPAMIERKAQALGS